MNNEVVLRFKNVSKSINKTNIFNDINLEVLKGEVVGIIGKNGSGKTTLLKLASGLSYPTKGDIYFFDKKLRQGFVGDLPQSIGILIETPTFISNLSGFENLYYLSKIKKVIKKDDIVKIIEKVGLDPNNKNPFRTYSLGMKQRLGIAQAIMEEPNLILFDEPTNALDDTGVEIFSNIILEYKERGKSFILVSHNMEEIKRFCDKVYKIENNTLKLQDKF